MVSMNPNKKLILIIDDDNKFSLGLSAVLRREGFEVVVAGNGEDGMAAIQSSNPDMILCDIMMPRVNGIKLKQALAKDPRFGNLPFFFLTARAAPMDKVVGLQSGADDYITKPFVVSELLARIQAVFRREDLSRKRGNRESLLELDTLRTNISSNLSSEMDTPPTDILTTLELILKEKMIRKHDEQDQ